MCTQNSVNESKFLDEEKLIEEIRKKSNRGCLSEVDADTIEKLLLARTPGSIGIAQDFLQR